MIENIIFDGNTAAVFVGREQAQAGVAQAVVHLAHLLTIETDSTSDPPWQ